MEKSPIAIDKHAAQPLPEPLSSATPTPPLEVVSSTPIWTARRRFKLSPQLLLILGAIVIGFAWYTYNSTLPPKCKGLISSDAEEYVRFAKRGLWNSFTHASHRTFGYLTFLALVRQLTPAWVDFLVPATLLQVVAYFASCLFLVSALKKTGVRVPHIALALVLVHPGLVSMSALALTDSLATSLLSCALATIILMTHDPRSLPIKSIALGICFGLLCSIRPSFNPIIIACGVMVSTSLIITTWRRTNNVKVALKAATTFAALFTVTLTPLYVHLLRNCYSAYSQICIVDPEFLSRATGFTLQAARDHTRFDIYIKPTGGVEFHPTLLPVLKDCVIDKQQPFPSLLDCYSRNVALVPYHFYTRLVGLFDNRRLNFFSIDETTSTVFWINRGYSIVGFFGIIIAIGLTAVGLVHRRPVTHLVLPLVYIAFQLLFHNEFRYAFPVTPILFLLSASFITTNQCKTRWQHLCLCMLATIVAVTFVTTVLPWDASNMRRWGHP